jgi:CheY-like chemotaxis protein
LRAEVAGWYAACNDLCSGPETVHVARERRPDVILLDVGLPGPSGFRVLEDLRKRSSTRELPVMLVSGQVDVK